MGSEIVVHLAISILSVALALLAWSLFLVYFGQKGTRHSPSASIRYRSRPMLAALTAAPVGIAVWAYGGGVEVPSVLSAASIAPPWIVAYFSMRFGIWRLLFVSAAVAVTIAVGLWLNASAASVSVGISVGIGAAFCLDMYWNHLAKKNNILLPG